MFDVPPKISSRPRIHIPCSWKGAGDSLGSSGPCGNFKKPRPLDVSATIVCFFKSAISPSCITHSPKINQSRNPGLSAPRSPRLCDLPSPSSVMFSLVVLPTVKAKPCSMSPDPDSLRLCVPQFTMCLGKPSSGPGSPPSHL